MQVEKAVKYLVPLYVENRQPLATCLLGLVSAFLNEACPAHLLTSRSSMSLLAAG